MSHAIFVPAHHELRETVPFASLLAGAQALVAGLAQEVQLRRDARHLGGLDARLLADLGIGAGQVEGAVRHGRAGVRVCNAGAQVQGEPLLLMPPSWTEWR